MPSDLRKFDSVEAPLSDSEKSAIRAYLQRAEVRLSTMHRIAGVFLNGAGILALFPILFKDTFTTVITGISSIAFIEHGGIFESIGAIFQGKVPAHVLGLYSCYLITLCVPVVSLGYLFRDIIAFYFTAHNPHKDGNRSCDADEEFYPRLALTGIPCSDDDINASTRSRMDDHQETARYKWFIFPYSKADRSAEYDRLPEQLMAPSKKARYENDKEHAADSKFDLKRLAIAFGLAGVDRRSLIEEAAKSELSLVRHALLLRRLVLRYMKALIAIIITACTSYLVIAILSAKIDGISDRATALILIGFVYQGWGLATALLVRLPIFWIWGRYIPSARRSDAAKDPHLVRFEWFVYAFSIITVLLATCFIITESKQHGYPFPIWAATILALISITIMIVLFLKQLSSHSVSAQKNRDLA